MTWNWQSPDWPNFEWDRSRISAAEEQFLLGAGIAIGAVKHQSEDEHKQLLVELMSGEAVTASAIEGEVLNRVSPIVYSAAAWTGVSRQTARHARGTGHGRDDGRSL
jgi:hypothetical protein